MHALPHPLAAFTRTRPDHLALRFGDATWSAAALLRAVLPAAGALAERGVGPGDRVALVGPPGPAWVIALHALGWRGASVLPVDPREPAVGRALRLRLAAHRLDLDDPLTCPWDHTIAATDRDLAAALAAPPTWPLDQERALLFTSGTTGDPRPVPLTTAQLFFAAVGGAIHLGHHLDDAWHACLAPWHVGGLSILLRTAWCQTTLDLAPAFDPAALSAALDAGHVTQLSLVPTMLRRLVEARRGRPFPSTLRWILLGGSAPDEADIAAAEALGATVCTTWGMTESAAQVATRSPARPREPGVVGTALPFVQVRARGERLVLSGPQIDGPEGELVTQDRGEVRASGDVIVHGRADRVVISGGRNIDPAAVERVLLQHPAVAHAHVRGLDDPRLGQALVAFIAPRDPAPADLARFAAARLHPHDRPRHWALVRAIPIGAAGKVSAADSASLLAHLEAQRAQLAEEPGGRVDRPETTRPRERHERVHVLDVGVPDIVGPLDREADPQPPLAEREPLDPHA